MRKILALALMVCGSLCADMELPPFPQSLYEISVKSAQGQSIPMIAFQSHVLLIVNIADNDQNVHQLSQLQDLYNKYSGQGFMVLGFPSNDFTPNSHDFAQELRDVYQGKYQVQFPIFEPIHVTGANKSPLYRFLTSTRSDPNFGWEVDWNFTKFLVDRTGKVVGRFSTETTAQDPRLIKAVEKALAQ